MLLAGTAGATATTANPEDRDSFKRGWRGTMKEAWDCEGIVGKRGREKCEKLEMLDEVEEFYMIMDRYYFVYI